MRQALEYQAALADPERGGLKVQTPEGRSLPELPGRVLEATYVDRTDALFFITHDILHEEQLDISLVRNGQLLDRLSIGQMCQPAEFGTLTQIEARRFTFTFPAEVTWALTVNQTPRFTLPNLRSAVSRLHLWQRYFALTKCASS